MRCNPCRGSGHILDPNQSDLVRCKPCSGTGQIDPVETFRDKAVRILKDLAESERLTHRGGQFDFAAASRADAFDRAAEMVQRMASSP